MPMHPRALGREAWPKCDDLCMVRRTGHEDVRVRSQAPRKTGKGVRTFETQSHACRRSRRHLACASFRDAISRVQNSQKTSRVCELSRCSLTPAHIREGISRVRAFEMQSRVYEQTRGNPTRKCTHARACAHALRTLRAQTCA
mmetsp:Transcript_11523/g.22341  ORF Transcript_11523/g.22341 Transcript_11523/m.22341 type:complete len:143 (+) Transcript_11523:220-648(+)